MISENSHEFMFIKMVIDRVKQYAFDNNCHIDEACCSVTGVNKKTYDEAIQFMISSGYRYNIYNKVKIHWREFDNIRTGMIQGTLPHLYREVLIPEMTISEQDDQGVWYCLSDKAYDEWCDYKKTSVN